MNIELIVCIAFAIMLVISMWMAGEYWKEKEHYRCRVFELTNGKEGGNLVKVVPDTPPPPAPEGLFPTRPKNRTMKVTKHYENDHVILYVTEGDTVQTTITLDNDRQMRRLGECLIDLERTGSREVQIIPNK